MLVSEPTCFMGIQVEILNSEGRSLITELDPNSTVETIKQIAVQHFYPSDSSTSTIKPEQFRVIYPAQSRTLNDSHAIHEEQLQEHDKLLFVKRRDTRVVDPINDQEMKAPTLAEINSATKQLEKPRFARGQGPNGASSHDTAESSVDFQLELRKILISLVSVMSTLLHGNTDADLICKEMHSRLKHRLAAASKPQEGVQIRYPPAPDVECNPMGIVHGLAEAKKREFRPNSKALESLREMGFGDEDIISALRACKNSKDAACEWLLAGRHVVIDDVETGLEQSSHLFNALVTNPTIRLGLNSPKTLLAFLGILESPASANLWLTDGDTAPVLSSIFKIYHSEKHASPDL